jgi:hypothetical protein
MEIPYASKLTSKRNKVSPLLGVMPALSAIKTPGRVFLFWEALASCVAPCDQPDQGNERTAKKQRARRFLVFAKKPFAGKMILRVLPFFTV